MLDDWLLGWPRYVGGGLSCLPGDPGRARHPIPPFREWLYLASPAHTTLLLFSLTLLFSPRHTASRSPQKTKHGDEKNNRSRRKDLKAAVCGSVPSIRLPRRRRIPQTPPPSPFISLQLTSAEPKRIGTHAHAHRPSPPQHDVSDPRQTGTGLRHRARPQPPPTDRVGAAQFARAIRQCLSRVRPCQPEFGARLARVHDRDGADPAAAAVRRRQVHRARDADRPDAPATVDAAGHRQAREPASPEEQEQEQAPRGYVGIPWLPCQRGQQEQPGRKGARDGVLHRSGAKSAEQLSRTGGGRCDSWRGRGCGEDWVQQFPWEAVGECQLRQPEA